MTVSQETDALFIHNSNVQSDVCIRVFCLAAVTDEMNEKKISFAYQLSKSYFFMMKYLQRIQFNGDVYRVADMRCPQKKRSHFFCL